MRSDASELPKASFSGPVMCFLTQNTTFSNIFTSAAIINYQHLIQNKHKLP